METRNRSTQSRESSLVRIALVVILNQKNSWSRRSEFPFAGFELTMNENKKSYAGLRLGLDAP